LTKNATLFIFVKKGYDFVGDNFGRDGLYNPIPDSDPLDNCTADAHGTHVAGIIGGDSTSLTGLLAPPTVMTGVAPECNILACKDFSLLTLLIAYI
jgi:subtilisin family serine protease